MTTTFPPIWQSHMTLTSVIGQIKRLFVSQHRCTLHFSHFAIHSAKGLGFLFHFARQFTAIPNLPK